MKKNVKNWVFESKLYEMENLIEIVDYQRSWDNWGVRFYSIGDWIKNCGCGLKAVNRWAWLLNNRCVRYNIGVYNEDYDKVSGLCLIRGEGVEVCKE